MPSAHSPNPPPEGGGEAPPTRVPAILATTSCALGILSLASVAWFGLSSLVTGLAAIVVGAVAHRRIRRSGAMGRLRAITGLMTGFGVCLFCGVIVLWFPFSDGGFMNAVPVTTQPRDEGTARDLGDTISEMGRCDTLEHAASDPDEWGFVCDRLHDDPQKFETFTIRVYADAATKRAQVPPLRKNGFPHKEGPYFLVIAAHGQPWSSLDGFPGSFPAHHP